jgi:hypothetical protein
MENSWPQPMHAQYFDIPHYEKPWNIPAIRAADLIPVFLKRPLMAPIRYHSPRHQGIAKEQ